ncbi:MAG TPA: PilC/PilY family type IV pilus protein [Methylophilus sp.]|nr:PilC/PilY family type IV pilus protein [Methylophilus sp.]
MTSPLQQTAKQLAQYISGFATSAIISFPLIASAALTDLGSQPLANTTTSAEVLPNLMYILDNSGSMSWDYMPDYVNDNNKCKTTGTSGAFSAACGLGDPPYMSNQFNSIYYDPTVTYKPPVNADGSSKNSMTSANTTGWTQVPIDAFGVYSTSKTSLVPKVIWDNTQGYSDKAWCNKTSGVTTADLQNPAVCKTNTQYIYPNNTGTQATSYNQAWTKRDYPYYYTIAAGEYCTNKNLTTCLTQTVPSAGYTFPAYLRWCTSSANVISGSGCQARYNEVTGHTYAKWSGISSGVSATAKIKINAQSPANTPAASPTALNVTGITVDGTSIIAATPALTITDTTNSTQRTTLAGNIASAINNLNTDDFSATASGDEVTITYIPATPYSGTVNVTTSSYTAPATTGTATTGTITITRARNSATINPIKIGTTTIMNTNATATASDNTTDLATKIKNNINAYVSSPVDYTATSSGNVVTITATTVGTAGNGTVSSNLGGASVTSGNIRYTSSGFSNGADGTGPQTYTLPTTITNFTGGTSAVNTFQRVDIIPTVTSYPKTGSRSDCAGATTCTFDEEMTNFANWYAYYRTRMQMMKTSTSHAFKAIDSRYRVGFITINNRSTNYLPVGLYDTTQKTSWYSKLFNAGGNSGTPLRSTLSVVGRIFAGQGGTVLGNAADPIQYSCQQNFSILTTDGYWNTDSDSAVQDLSANQIGDRDGTGVPRPMYEGPTATNNSLADVAKYYYDTDLRTSSLGNCTGGVRANGTTGDVCENNVFVTTTDNNIKQHMTTFTLGLGVDASLEYTSDYKTATQGDFYELQQGTLDWPVPQADKQTAVDDLWHAAVNGQGTYFSAKNPNQLSTSLSEALQSIKSKVGAGAAAATSTLNPVQGNNYSYVASYTTVKWTGNLESRSINTDTGKVSEDATWCVENVVADTCAAPSVVEAVTSGSSTQYVCKTGGSDAASCPAPGVLTGTDCRVEIATACTGTLQSKISDTTDTRNIYMNVNGILGDFSYANLVAAGKNGTFDNAFLKANLPQVTNDFDNLGNPMSATKTALIDGASLVNFLRGNTGFENRSSNLNGTVDTRIYRLREATLGDLVDSTPVYVGPPKAAFSDPGYGPETVTGTFKATYKDRPGTVYIGANDGMLHAINAEDGQERWAFVPSMVIDNMWKLASKNYDIGHTYYINGDIVVNDICTANCTTTTATWKTILVAGLNGGGKGYFALDITNPNSPILLWEFDTSDDGDLGYSYGNPIITKKSDGTWVVVLTSGYNNVTGSNPNKGQGFLYVLNANTGTVLNKYSTGVGDSATPSGLAKVNAYVYDAFVNNTAVYLYGGDLLGNLWRFDINSPQSSSNPFKLAVLKDPSGTVQPITVRPELAEISGKRVIYVGTGRYLGANDLTDTQQQTIYAITDENSGTPTTLDNPRSSSAMVQQTLVNDTGTGTRSMGSPIQTVNFASGRGWFIDFPDTGERQNVPAQLVFGTLLLPTTVPTNTVCSPGGYGWLNFLDYKTGASVAGNVVATKTNAPIVGINVIYVKGEPVVNIVTADNPTPTFPPEQPNFSGGGASGFTNHRVIWRELIDESN